MESDHLRFQSPAPIPMTTALPSTSAEVSRRNSNKVQVVERYFPPLHDTCLQEVPGPPSVTPHAVESNNQMMASAGVAVRLWL